MTTVATTKSVRIWKEVHEPYRDISNEASIVLSDFISLVLLYASFEEWLITYILQEEFEIGFEYAKKYAMELRKRMVETLKAMEVLKQIAKTEKA